MIDNLAHCMKSSKSGFGVFCLMSNCVAVASCVGFWVVSQLAGLEYCRRGVNLS